MVDILLCIGVINIDLEFIIPQRRLFKYVEDLNVLTMAYVWELVWQLTVALEFLVVYLYIFDS